ncbi:MAG TPA: DUF5700 domain-containing putative Zn-dependent protease, partial [Bacteroidota bacterium]|nr:DUF5700 domain-containing putative Zn-dependent protease [Bacteroidota bacterium]
PLSAQTNPNFDVALRIDYESAEKAIEFYGDGFENTEELSSLRGSRIAASTAGYIAQRGNATQILKDYLDSLKNREIIRDDVFHLEEARSRVGAMKALLQIIKRENFSRRVSATVEQIFPQDAKISASIPLYFVAFGSNKVDAFVQRLTWNGDEPHAVGEGQGELTIVVNLAHAVEYPGEMPVKYVTLLGVVAHEVFHAAFGVYKDGSPLWKMYLAKHNKPIDELLDITQNEGIAYYLSLDEAGRGRLPRDWIVRMQQAFETYNKNAAELAANGTSQLRVSELIRTANLSGYWESYGSMTGMYMAREIDQDLGRAALIETIRKGPQDFFRKYESLQERDSNLPKLTLWLE